MKRIQVTYTIRDKTEGDLREYAKETGHSMSLIVDLAIENYLKTIKKEGKL